MLRFTIGVEPHHTTRHHHNLHGAPHPQQNRCTFELARVSARTRARQQQRHSAAARPVGPGHAHATHAAAPVASTQLASVNAAALARVLWRAAPAAHTWLTHAGAAMKQRDIASFFGGGSKKADTGATPAQALAKAPKAAAAAGGGGAAKQPGAAAAAVGGPKREVRARALPAAAPAAAAAVVAAHRRQACASPKSHCCVAAWRSGTRCDACHAQQLPPLCRPSRHIHRRPRPAAPMLAAAAAASGSSSA